MSGIQQLLFATKGLAGVPGVVTLSDQNLAVTGNYVDLWVAYELGSSDGIAYRVSSYGAQALEQWVTPVGAAGNFEVYVTVISGGPVNGTLNAWLPITTHLRWYIIANTTINQIVTARIAVTIRRLGQATPDETAYIDLRVSKT